MLRPGRRHVLLCLNVCARWLFLCVFIFCVVQLATAVCIFVFYVTPYLWREQGCTLCVCALRCSSVQRLLHHPISSAISNIISVTKAGKAFKACPFTRFELQLQSLEAWGNARFLCLCILAFATFSIPATCSNLFAPADAPLFKTPFLPACVRTPSNERPCDGASVSGSTSFGCALPRTYSCRHLLRPYVMYLAPGADAFWKSTATGLFLFAVHVKCT